MWKPTGSCKPPLAGGGIALLSSTFKSGRFLFDELFVLRLVRGPSSTSSSPSPTSTLVTVPLLVGPSAALDLVLGRLLGAFAVSAAAADFLSLRLVIALEAESAASSPEASREDGWRRSAVDDCLIELWSVVLRFRFPEPEEDGDDITWRCL